MKSHTSGFLNVRYKKYITLLPLETCYISNIMLILGGQELSLILININAYTFYVGTLTH